MGQDQENNEIRFEFNGDSCWAVKQEYADGSWALRVMTDAEGYEEPQCTATVFLQPLAPPKVTIKDYRENAGIKKALVDAGIIKQTGEWVRTDFAEAEICEVLI